MKKAKVFLADGFEEIEAITVIDVLRRSGVDVKTISVTDGREVRGAHNIRVMADVLYEQAEEESADMIVLPGGMPGTLNLEAHAGLKGQLESFAKTGKYIAAICAAPSVLGKMGLLKDRDATCYPGFERHLFEARVKEDAVIQHGNIITSRGPGTAMAFSFKLVELLMGKEIAEELKENMIAAE